MKKLLTVLILCFSAVTLSAQRFAVDVDASGSTGMDRMQGSKYAGQLKAAAGLELGKFMFGVGTGFNYATVLAGRWYSTTDRSEQFVYQTEYLVPVFARLKYTFHNRNLNIDQYILVDGGWSFNVGGQKAEGYELPIEDGKPCGMPLDYTGRAGGLYAEPQIGVCLWDKVYVGLGFMMQAYEQYAVAVSGTLDAQDQNYGAQTYVSEMTRKNYFNALSLHVGINF